MAVSTRLGYSVLVSSGDGASGRTRSRRRLPMLRSVVLFAALLKRTAVARPVAGAIIGAVCLTGNLVVSTDDVRARSALLRSAHCWFSTSGRAERSRPCWLS